MMRASKRALPAVLSIGALLVVVSVGVAENDSSNLPGSDVRQVEAVEPEASSALSVLRRDRAAIDHLPGDLAEQLDRQADFGLNPRLSRIAIGNATNAVYVIPAAGHVCVGLTQGEGMGLTCPSTDDITRGDVAPATLGLSGDDIGIYGLVPDGVESVSVRTDTSESTIPTQGNAYYTVVPAGGPQRKVRYTGPSGPVEFDVVDPSRVFESQETAPDE